ncbi:MAG TPA: cytochrome c biogenesis protein CcsA [Candidatus Azoamicus sp. OHIO2]
MNKIYYYLLIVILILFLYFWDTENKYKNFAEMPILSDGRVKPLESFAKSNFNTLFYKKKNKYYSYYIAEIIFSFDAFSKKKIFKITDESILINMDMQKTKTNLYSFIEIFSGIFKNIEIINIISKSDFTLLNASQIELLNIYNKILFILNMRETFKVLTNLSYISDSTEYIKYNNNEEYFYIIKKNDGMWTNLNNNDLSTIISVNGNIIQTLIAMQNFYINKNITHWSKECFIFNTYSNSKFKPHEYLKFKIELLYNKVNFLLYSVICYLLFFVLACLITIKSFYKKYTGILEFMLLTGFIFSFCDLILRFFISERPPVTNLYESIIFVNFVCTLFFLIVINKIKTQVSLIIIALALFLLQLIGYNYNYDAEIKNLMSVLNTNFWLTLHVLTITTGYASCLISSILGHVTLYYSVKNDEDSSQKFFNYTYLFLLISLFFVFNGTILGGIWADQSWGRFWGWDPKENGALLVVLWLVLILHVKLINKSKVIFSIGAIELSTVVALSWFGVNILNVGLHSYGFTKSMSVWLLLFIFFELVYICVSLYIYKEKKINLKQYLFLLK